MTCRARYVGMISDQIKELGYNPERYDIAAIMGVIQVESNFDPDARRPGSQYCGLMQMGRLAGIDVGMPDQGKDTTAPLLGRPEAAINAFLRYCHRYRSRWRVPSEMATLWKAGPGSMKTVLARLDAGDTFEDALRTAEDKHNVPNVVEYYRRHFNAWAAWVDEI